MSTILEETVKRLNRIAAAVGDGTEFVYNIGIEVRRKGLVYYFSCLDHDDQSEFVSGVGCSPDEAARAAATEITKACETHEYEEVD